MSLILFSFPSLQEDLVRGAGGIRKFIKGLRPREIQIQSILNHASFDAFYLTRNGVVDLHYHCVTHGVLKRFWGTSSIFHFRFGEMTITHYGFAMLTVVGFAGELLVYQEDFYTNHDQRFHFFGPVVESIPYEDYFSYNILVNLINDDVHQAQHSPDYQSLIILALLISMPFLLI